jgi:hypothetical protein
MADPNDPFGNIARQQREDDELQASPSLTANDLKILGGYVPKTLAELPSLPTRMYSTISDALKLATKTAISGTRVGNALSTAPFIGPALTGAGAMGFDGLPGAEGARGFSDKVDETALDIGSKVAGQELHPGFGEDSSAADKVGTALGMGFGMLPVTGGPIKAAFDGVKNIRAGVKAIDEVVPAATEIAKFFSPLVPTDSARSLIAGNAAVGGALSLASDALSTPATNNGPPNPEFVAAMDQFVKSTDQAHAQLNAESESHLNTALDGVGQVSDTHHAITAGFGDLDDWKTYAAASTGLGVLMAGKHLSSNVIRDLSLRFVGGKEFSKEAKLDFVTKPEASSLSPLDVAKSQAVNAATPLVKNSANPEHTQALFENIGAAWEVHSTSLMENGKFANSRITLNQPLSEFIDHMRDNVGSDPAKFKLFNDGANAISELGNRNRAWLNSDQAAPVLKGSSVNNPAVTTGYKRWLASGGDEVKFSFDMSNQKYGDLEAVRLAAMADPEVKAGLDMLSDITKKSLQYRVEQGANTLREFNDMMKAHPVYFPTRQAASHMAPLELSEAAGRMVPGDITKEVMPYLEQTVREVAESRLRTAFIEEAKASKAAFLGKELPQNSINVKNKDKMVSYRDANANPRTIEVNDPMIRAALAPGAGSAIIRLNQGLLKALSLPSRMTETLTTHPLTAVVGSPFAVGNMAYGSTATLINRQAGMRAGWIDGFVQDHKILGVGKDGLARGVRGDPTFYAQTIAQAGSSFLARLAQYGGKAIENSVHSSWLAPSMSSGTLAKLGAAMSNHYKASMLYELQSQGLHGGATAMGRAQTYTLKDLENSLTPATRLSEGWKATSNFAWDLFRAIGDAPQAAYYKQNKGRVSQELLTTRVRNVMGDPSKAGLGTSEFGKSALGAVILHPWGSVTLQSFAKLLESAHQNPSGTALAITNAIAIPSILLSNWNLSLGKEYVDYQHNKRTPDQVAGSMYFGIPGRPPEEGLEWRVDQPMRPFKVLVDTLYGHMYGLHDGSVFKPENDFIRRGLVDGVATRYGIWGDAMKSAVGQVLPAIPTAVQLAGSAAGGEFRSYTEGVHSLLDKNKNAGASDSTSKVIDNHWFGYPVSANMEATLSNTGGQIGNAIYEMLTAHFQGQKDGLTLSDQRSDYLDRFGMRLGQSAREVSGLWGHAATISPSQEASAKTLTEQMEGLRKLDAASQKLRGLQGSGDLLSGAKGRSIDSLAGSGPVQFKDQQMAALAFDAQRFVSVYDKQFSGRLKDLYEQRSSILSSEKVAPDVKHTMMNDNAKLIVDENRRALSALEQWKWRVSKAYNRDIDPRNIKLDQPIDQFKSLLSR